MSLSVADALRDGLGRTFERNGLQLVAAFVVVRLASTVATNTLNRANLDLARELGTFPVEAGGPFAGLADAPTPFAIGLGLGGAFALFVAVAVLAEVARLVAVRTLFTDRTDAVPGAAVRRRLPVATLNGVVGGVVVATLTVIGLVLLIVPGLFLAVSFLFLRQEIAVRDRNFVDAMAGSWTLTRGHRLGLFGLLVALSLVVLATTAVGALASSASPSVGAAVSAVLDAVVVVFGVASVTRAYAQLRGEADAEAAEEDPYAGALTADDLAPPDGRDGW